MKFKIILIAFIFGILAITPLNPALAQDGEYDMGPMIYKFHLQFRSGKVTPIIKDVLPYDFISDEFVDQAGLYYGKVFSMKNEVLGEFHYDLLEGENEVLAPYFSEAKTVAFYKSKDDKEPMLAISVSKTSLCNQDNVCQKDAGETENNCASDCRLNNPTNNNSVNPASNTSNTNVISNSNEEQVKKTAEKFYNYLIIAFVVLGLITIAIFIYLYIKAHRNN